MKRCNYILQYFFPSCKFTSFFFLENSLNCTVKEEIYTTCNKIEFFVVKIRSEIDVAWLSVARWKVKYFVNKKYHRHREERDSIVRKAIPCVRFGSGDRSGCGRQEKGRIRGCIVRVTGCNRCYQVEVSGQIRVRCLHLTGFGRKHRVREIARIEGLRKGN